MSHVRTGFPNCCGASVLYSFSAPDFNKLVYDVQEYGEGGNKMQLVILNDSQCNGDKPLLAMLAALGFVWVSRSNNGLHDSWINLFVRSDHGGSPKGKRTYKKPAFTYPGRIAFDPSHNEHVLLERAKPKGVTVANPFAPPPGPRDIAFELPVDLEEIAKGKKA